VTLVPKAVYSGKGKARFCLSSGLRGKISSEPGRCTEVEVDTLDNILQDLQVDKVDFIKMDIEGAEIEALAGMENTLESCQALKLAVAAYHRVRGEPTYKTVIPYLQQKGFKTVENEGIIYGGKKLSMHASQSSVVTKTQESQ
jgi:hypothetical protein